MAELMGLDVAWDRPTVAQILATGAHWVARYFSPDASKNLTASEVVSYPAAGLAVVTVYESTAGRALQGRAAGVADAQSAERQRKAVGLPGSVVLHFAVDTDTSWSSVAAYFQGVLSVLPLARVGCYGGYSVIAGAHGAGIRYLWQTVAWSGGRWHPSATIRQPGGMLLGGAADVDCAEAADFGQFPRPVSPKPVPVVPPVPPASSSEDEMAFQTTALPDGFGQDVTGAFLDTSRVLVVPLPPRNGAYWGAVYVSFASDLGSVNLRVAVLNAAGVWRVEHIAVLGAGPRVSVPLLDGDVKLSVMRQKTSAADTADSIPVGVLVEAFAKA
ncbi:glycoside hydrolase domain-containing protein [Streptacidiphilus sp. PAMC 29251]